MAVTNILNMVEVNEKFSTYVIDRSTELNRMVTAGIASSDPVIGQLINGTPAGGRFIEIPAWNALEGEDEVFGEHDVSVGNITTKSSHASLTMRQRAWGATDLSHVLGGADPMGAIGNLLADWWNSREQKMYLSILKGILDPTNGALKSHVNDISAATGTGANLISDGATLDTKQLLGDHYESLGMVFMHSAVYTYLQKAGLITRNPIFDPAQSQIEMERYLGYRIIVDDGMPVIKYEKSTSSTSGALKVVEDTATPTSGEIKISDVKAGGLTDIAVNDYVVALSSYNYVTYFLGANAFIRQDGTPAGFVGSETDRDKLGAKDYLINRRCMIIHPRGFSWNTNATLTETIGSETRTLYYPNNTHLATPGNWTLATDAKKIPIAALIHKIG